MNIRRIAQYSAIENLEILWKDGLSDIEYIEKISVAVKENQRSYRNFPFQVYQI